MTDGHDPFDPPQRPSPFRAGGVAGDLQAIFADATPARGLARPTSKVRAIGHRRGRLPYATLGAVAAAAIVGLTAGSLMTVQGQPAAPAHTPAKAAAVVPIEVAATPPISLTAKPAGPIPVLDNAPVSPKAAVHVRRHVAARHSGPTDLMAADRRLRVAYAHAVHAGVPRRILASYRDRWADLREDASWRPARVAAGYGQMSADLERMARRPNARPQAGRFSLFDIFS